MAKGKNKKNRKETTATQAPKTRKEAETSTKAGLPNKGGKASATKAPKVKVPYTPLLEAANLRWIGIGTAVLLIGYLLMIGGKSPDPNVYDEKALFSFTRITLAPILICLGFGLQMYGILLKTPKSRPEASVESTA